MKPTEEFEIIPDEQETPRRRVLTVSQLNRQVRFFLESEYQAIWLEGEISNFKKHSSGHMYLSLKDDRSQISGVFFSRYNSRVKFELKDGLKVLAYGKASLYEPRGQYQFFIERIEPKGVGDLQLAFQQLKEKLEKEGLFSEEHKKPIPRFPKRVGVVTSPTGAAIRDILNVIHRRFCGTEVLIYPVSVQGDGSAVQVAQAIKEMNDLGEIDVLIVGRGGGSLEDLWAFNEEPVARAVFASKIPIISAVGHEIDWTICDLVSDLRAPTPSAAAELVVQSSEELMRRVQEVTERMQTSMSSLFEGKREDLLALQESYAFKQPRVIVQQFSQRVDELLRQLQNYLKAYVVHKGQHFQTIVGQLHALSPLAILERGYSISFSKDGKPLKDIRPLKKGDEIQTRLSNGMVRSQVTSIEKVKGKSHERE